MLPEEGGSFFRFSVALVAGRNKADRGAKKPRVAAHGFDLPRDHALACTSGLGC